MQLSLCRVAAVESHYSAAFIFWSFVITGFILNHFENKMLLEPVVGGVARTAHVITGHEQTQLNRVCCYLFLCALSFKGAYYSELIYLRCS